MAQLYSGAKQVRTGTHQIETSSGAKASVSSSTVAISSTPTAALEAHLYLLPCICVWRSWRGWAVATAVERFHQRYWTYQDRRGNDKLTYSMYDLENGVAETQLWQVFWTIVSGGATRSGIQMFWISFCNWSEHVWGQAPGRNSVSTWVRNQQLLGANLRNWILYAATVTRKSKSYPTIKEPRKHWVRIRLTKFFGIASRA